MYIGFVFVYNFEIVVVVVVEGGGYGLVGVVFIVKIIFDIYFGN